MSETPPTEPGRPEHPYDRLPDDVRNVVLPRSLLWVVDAMEREAAFLLRHAAKFADEDARRIAQEMRQSWEGMAAAALRESSLLEQFESAERIVAVALANEALMAMARESAADAEAHGTDHWPTVEQVQAEHGTVIVETDCGPIGVRNVRNVGNGAGATIWDQAPGGGPMGVVA